MALLRFIYRTLPNFAGKLLKTPSKEENKKKVQKGQEEQKGSFTRLQYASSSQWRATSANKSRKAHSLATTSPPTRNGE